MHKNQLKQIITDFDQYSKFDIKSLMEMNDEELNCFLECESDKQKNSIINLFKVSKEQNIKHQFGFYRKLLTISEVKSEVISLIYMNEDINNNLSSDEKNQIISQIFNANSDEEASYIYAIAKNDGLLKSGRNSEIMEYTKIITEVDNPAKKAALTKLLSSNKISVCNHADINSFFNFLNNIEDIFDYNIAISRILTGLDEIIKNNYIDDLKKCKIAEIKRSVKEYNKFTLELDKKEDLVILQKLLDKTEIEKVDIKTTELVGNGYSYKVKFK